MPRSPRPSPRRRAPQRDGAPRQAAAELADHALRLTPTDDPARVDRLLAARRRTSRSRARSNARRPPHAHASSRSRPGRARARAWFLLTRRRRREQPRDPRPLRARAGRERATIRACGRPCWASSLPTSRPSVSSASRMTEAWAEEARRARAQRRATDAELPVLYALAWARSLGGRPVDDLCERFRELTEDECVLHGAVARARRGSAARLAWLHPRGARRADAASWTWRTSAASRPRTRSSASTCASSSCGQAGGTPPRASSTNGRSPSDDALLLWPMYERCRALLAVGRGEPAEALRWADGGDRARQSDRIDLGPSSRRRARWGSARLLAREPGPAAESAALGLGAHRARRRERPGRLPRGARARRGARRPRRARRGAGGRPAPRRARGGAGSPLGPRDDSPLSRSDPSRASVRRPVVAASSRRSPESTPALGLAFDARALAPRARPGAAPAPEVGRGPRRCSAGSRRLRRARLARLGRGEPCRASSVSAPARPPASGELTRGGAPCRRARGAGAREQGDRAAPRRHASAPSSTTSRRRYAKLGIRSRAQLAARASGTRRRTNRR